MSIDTIKKSVYIFLSFVVGIVLTLLITMPMLAQAQQGGPPSSPPGGGGMPLPFICTKCDLIQEFHTEITQGNYANAVLWRSEFSDMDISNSSFSGAKFGQADMTNVNASSVDFSGGDLRLSGFHSTILQNANFTDANLKLGEIDATSDVTGAIWSNTICPDGTNSDNNGNTCVGHLSP